MYPSFQSAAAFRNSYTFPPSSAASQAAFVSSIGRGPLSVPGLAGNPFTHSFLNQSKLFHHQA